MIGGEENIGGIQASVLTTIGKGPTEGQISHRKLIYEATERSILVTDEQEPHFHFRADVDADGFVKFDVYTRGWRGNKSSRHPDFYATSLAKRCVDVFRSRGIEIHGMKSQWINKGPYASQNASEYQENVDNGMTPTEAAKHTWSGELAADLGFPNLSGEPNPVDYTHPTERRIYVTFVP
jgi:hypothetical protein